MTKKEVTEICVGVYHTAKSLLPPDIASTLTSDKDPKPEKTAVLGFSIWDKNKRGLWDRHYCSYHISYDPLHESCHRLWHVRLMYFRNRKQTGSGRFNTKMGSVMRSVQTPQGFEFVENDRLLCLWKRYNHTTRDALLKSLPPDLAWLIQATYPKIDAFLCNAA